MGRTAVRLDELILGLPIGTLAVFAPVVVFRLKWGLQKGFARTLKSGRKRLIFGTPGVWL